VKSGWIPVIGAAADRYQFTTELLLAIASRETNLDVKYQRVPGDRGHGFSMWQLDIGSHRDWIATGAWKDVGTAVMKAGEALAAKRAEVKAEARRRNLVLAPTDVERITVAAYNCGSGPALSSFVRTNGADADRATTGHDYSADAIARRDVFASFLASSGTIGVKGGTKPSSDGTKQPAGETNQLNDVTAPDLFDRLRDNDDAKNFGRSAGRKLVNRLGTPITTFLAALEAGNWKAWLAVTIVAVGLAVFIYDERRAIARLVDRFKAKL
jgi:hypothetical protein